MRVHKADIVQVAIRLIGEQELAFYLGVEEAQLRRYAAGGDEMPQLIALRLVDRLLAESAHPSASLEAMADVLLELSRA